jgi:hypothetical protein
MKYSQGDIYNGNWQNDKAHGYGEMKYPNNSKYEGQWVEGKING